MIEGSTLLRRKSDVRFRHIEPDTLVIRQAGPEVLVLNGVAGRVLELMDDAKTARDLVAGVQSEFAAPAAEIERDVLAFLDELIAAEIIEEAPTRA